VTNHRVTFLQLGQFSFQPFTLCGNLIRNVVIFKMLQGGQASGHRQLVTTEGAGMVARLPGVKLFLDAQYRERQAAADRFRHHDDVRLDAGVFEGEQLARTGETGLTTLQHLTDNKIADKVAAQGEWLTGKLTELQKRYPVIGNIRGPGLMVGIEIVKPEEAQDHMGCYPADGQLSALLQKKCFEAGLILERGGRNGCVLRLLPSLLITNDELGIFLDKFEQALLAAGVKPV